MSENIKTRNYLNKSTIHEHYLKANFSYQHSRTSYAMLRTPHINIQERRTRCYELVISTFKNVVRDVTNSSYQHSRTSYAMLRTRHINIQERRTRCYELVISTFKNVVRDVTNSSYQHSRTSYAMLRTPHINIQERRTRCYANNGIQHKTLKLKIIHIKRLVNLNRPVRSVVFHTSHS